MACPVCTAGYRVDMSAQHQPISFYGKTCSRACARTLQITERLDALLRLFTDAFRLPVG